MGNKEEAKKEVEMIFISYKCVEEWQGKCKNTRIL